MKTTNSFAIHLMLFLLCVVIVFHLLILLHIIPYEITWGGRLKNDAEMYVFETISIAINLFLGWVVLMKAGYVNFRFPRKVLNFLLWFFLLLFMANTIGNLFATTILEKMFSVLTFIFAVLIWKILRMKKFSESS